MTRTTLYKLYQVKRDLTRDFGFMDYDMMQDLDIELNINNYNLVAEEEITVGNYRKLLNDLFTTYNNNHPEGYEGRSMSVSDIVCIDGCCYYCDSIGWCEIKLQSDGGFVKCLNS